MIYLSNFVMDHLDQILPNLRQEDAISLEGFDKDEYREWVKTLCADAPIASFLCEEGVAAIGGAIRQWDGVAQWWMLTTPLVEKYPVSFQRACKDGLNFMTEAFHIHRLEASVAQNHTMAQRWAESHGFVNEGLMVAYGPDKANHYRYARIRL